jgi:hypothetical protein
MRPMSMTLTLSLLAGLAAMTLFAGWRGSLPPNLVKGPRMIPWRVIMVVSAAGVAMMAVHLATLIGSTISR